MKIKLNNVLLTKLIIILISICLTSACASKKPSRYKQKYDAAPKKVKMHKLKKAKNATPRIESKSRIGNPKSYVVFNKRYRVLNSSKGFVQKGIASWYGTKFHGHKTSNGEVYNMYAMTAAHKNLPLPTYAEVKNLKNGKKIIVRINDRGPFHAGRVIDLSYAAAYKLGMLGKGTADVEVRAIEPRRWLAQRYKYRKKMLSKSRKNKVVKKQQATVLAAKNNNALKLQVGAFSNKESASELAKKVNYVTNLPVEVTKIVKNDKTLFKVRIVKSSKNNSLNVEKITNQLLSANLPSPIIISE